MKKTLVFSLILFIFFSCKKERFESVINPELAPYIQTFIEEGKKRGVNLSTEKLEAYLVEDFSLEEARGFCGYGWWNYKEQNTARIEIKDSDPCWRLKTELAKENFVFHELGHALLSRRHINEKLPNEVTPKSIMCGDGECSNSYIFFANGPLRDYYFDELFNASTPFPTSFEKKNFVRTLFQEDFENYEEDWVNFIVRDSANLNQFSISIDSTNSNTTQMSNALTLSSQSSTIENAYIVVYKRFDLTDFQDCSNLKAKATIRTDELSDGYFEMGLSLRERLSDGEFDRFFLNEKRQSTFNRIQNTFKDFELELYCIPENTDVVTISFTMSSKTAATVFIDEVVVDLIN